jgi:ABC-type glycerol-3-phosphate transport system substrate-binding protein
VIEKEVTRIVEGTPQVVKETVVVEREVTAAPVAEEEIRKIVWSTWAGGDAEVKLKQSTVDVFNQTRGAELGIEVSARIITDYAGYFTKTETSFAGGDAPDAVWCDHRIWGGWILSGWLRDLTPYVELEPEVSAIRMVLEKIPDYSHSFLGRVYGIPHLVQIMGTWVNKEMFEAAGIELPPLNWGDPSWTAERVTEIAIALTKRNSKGVAEQLGVNIPCCFLGGGPGYALVQSNGGRAFDSEFSQWMMDEEEASAVVQWAFDNYNKYKTCPTPDETQAGISFWTGKVGMDIAWLTWPARLVEASYGVWTPSPHPLPIFKEPKEWAHGIPIACSKQSKYPEAVIEFARWMVEEGDDINVGMGYAAPILPKHEALLLTEAPGLPYVSEELKKMPREPFLQALNYAKVDNPHFSRWHIVNRDIWQVKVIDVLISGAETDAAKLIASVEPDVNKELEQARKDIAEFTG